MVAVRFPSVSALIQGRPVLARLIRNVGWQSFDRIFRMGGAVVVSVIIVRYLGPERFGTYSYALAFVGIFAALAGLGLDGIVVREIARDVTRRDTILGTAFGLKLAGGLFSFLVVLALIKITNRNDSELVLITAFFALGLMFSSLDVIDFWFQSRIQAKPIALARSSAFVASSILKIVLVLYAASLVALAAATVAETVLAAVGLAIAYRLTGQEIRHWRPDPRLAKTLLAESWPLIISGFTILIYMRIDQVMLGAMMDKETVGIYAAAVKFSEAWYFIPGSISVSVFPLLVSLFQNNRSLFWAKYQNVFNIMAGISMAIALGMTFLSTGLVRLVYGKEYIASGPILAIHIWAGVFVFLGFGGSIWTMINGYQKFALAASLAGLATKITLNFLLIPARGAMGAAVSMVISQAVAAYLFYASSARTRRVFALMSRALVLPWRFVRTRTAEGEPR